MRKWLLLLAVLGLTVPVPAQDADDLARLVNKLGSPRYREREAAMTALLQQRTPAVVAQLRQAARHSDLEIRKRAQEILAVIERALESEQLLQPQKLRLEFKDVLVADAVADFAKRTGLKLVLADSDKAKLSLRKVTLDTGVDVSYWEALRQLCDKAGLCEKLPDANARRVVDPLEDLGGRRRVIWMSKDRMPPPVVEQIILGDGKHARPTFQNGALRLQVLSRPGAPQAGPPGREVELTLAADVEARFNWNRLVAIRVEHALDDRDQKLSQPGLFIGEQANPLSYQEEVFIIWDGMTEMPRVASRQGSIRLKLGEKQARTIKELRGKLVAEVEAPESALVAIGDLMKASGKTFKGLNGAAIKVMEAKRENSGQYKLQVEVTLPANPTQIPDFMGNVIWLNRGPVPANGTVNLSASEVQQKGLSLHDAEGQPFILASGQHVRAAKPSDPIVYTLYYEPRKGQGAPAKFVLTGRRNVLIEVPFVLRDVPLP